MLGKFSKWGQVQSNPRHSCGRVPLHRSLACGLILAHHNFSIRCVAWSQPCYTESLNELSLSLVEKLPQDTKIWLGGALKKFTPPAKLRDKISCFPTLEVFEEAVSQLVGVE